MPDPQAEPGNDLWRELAGFVDALAFDRDFAAAGFVEVRPRA
jgi:hypothetical protein